MTQPTTAMADWVLPEDLTLAILDYAKSVARRNGAAPDVADDIAQVTVIRLNEAASRNSSVIELLSKEKWHGYVATATRNVLAGHHRSEARRVKREALSAQGTERLSEEAAELQQLEAHVVLEEAAAAVLDAQERMFVHLRFAQGLTIRETAEEMGITEGIAWHVGRRSLDKLARHLRDMR